jgi:acyl-CoA synthetase (AMP-forming)/AMP-acid ligase II
MTESSVDGPTLFAALTRTGDPASPALVLPHAATTIDYAGLPALADGWRAALSAPDKSLVLCLAGRNLATVACYLAVLRLGHAVAMLDAGGSASARDRFLAAYQPDFVAWCPDDDVPPPAPPPGYRHRADPAGATVWARTAEPDGTLHRDLALVLSTSGSTGNPKAVRLSYANVASNAVSISESIGIAEADRAATGLPLHFGYGLSVVSSHLITGASVAIRPERPASRAFWRHFAEAGCTNFPGVAPTYDVLWRLVSDLDRVPGLRSMTCSGSRLRSDLVLRFAEFMDRRGGRLFMMYGQTEATSRISCLHPDDLPARVGSVGKAIPRGRLSIRTDGAILPDGESGEIVYTGPNVMLGYAESRLDLSRGDVTAGVLHTGDLGYLDGGFLYLTGRTKRIAKIVGLRLSLDDIERLFEDAGTVAAVDAGDRGILLFTEDPPEPIEAARHRVATELGIPASLLLIRPAPELPRTPTGKIDYRTLAGR